MQITHQDILDKEFRVKFRGFDMAEVDTFLEELAEFFFKLTEENSLLREKVSALQEEIESAERAASPGQMELPAEMLNFLEELKQDAAAINAEIVTLKQDRPFFASLYKNIKAAVAALQKAATSPPQTLTELPADLNSTLEELKKSSDAIAAEMNSLKEDRQAFDDLQKNLENENLAETLAEFRKGTETMIGEISALKEGIGFIQQIREEVKSELQELLTSYFNDLDAKLSKVSPVVAPAVAKSIGPAAKKKEEELAAAIIEEEPEGTEEDSRVYSFDEEDDDFDDDLEFLSEDDILDVDKLRGVFQSVLDNSLSDTPNSREFDDDSSSDLLFLEDILEDEPEPEVSFSLEGGNGGENPEKEEISLSLEGGNGGENPEKEEVSLSLEGGNGGENPEKEAEA